MEAALIPQDQGLNAAAIFTDSAGRPQSGVVDGIKDPVHSGLPRIVIAGGFAPLGSADPRPLSRTTYELFENMPLLNPFGRSRHSWRWGFHMRREEFRGRNDQSSRSLFNLASFADFAAGLVDNAILRSGSTLNYTRHYPWDLYWQDQYKLPDNFTLNYGIRCAFGPRGIAEPLDQLPSGDRWLRQRPGLGHRSRTEWRGGDRLPPRPIHSTAGRR